MLMLGLVLIAYTASALSQVQQIVASKEERTLCIDEYAILENSDRFMPGYSLFEEELENLDKSQYPSARFDISCIDDVADAILL